MIYNKKLNATLLKKEELIISSSSSSNHNVVKHGIKIRQLKNIKHAHC